MAATSAAAQAGLVAEKDARTEVFRLQDQQVALEQQLRSEKQASAAETQGLEARVADQKIAELEARKGAGETGVDKKLEKLRIGLQDIETQKQAEIEARGECWEAHSKTFRSVAPAKKWPMWDTRISGHRDFSQVTVSQGMFSSQRTWTHVSC